jgi:hypothetical protein
MISEIWQRMSEEKGHEVIGVVNETNKRLYRRAVELLAPHMGMRAARVWEMPKRERHGVWIGLFRREEFGAFGFNFLSWWLMVRHGEMLGVWLDSLGIWHRGGVVEEFPRGEPPMEVLVRGVDRLVERFDLEDVRIYLRAFYEIDEVRWEGLARLIQRDERLRWG